MLTRMEIENKMFNTGCPVNSFTFQNSIQKKWYNCGLRHRTSHRVGHFCGNRKRIVDFKSLCKKKKRQLYRSVILPNMSKVEFFVAKKVQSPISPFPFQNLINI